MNVLLCPSRHWFSGVGLATSIQAFLGFLEPAVSGGGPRHVVTGRCPWGFDAAGTTERDSCTGFADEDTGTCAVETDIFFVDAFFVLAILPAFFPGCATRRRTTDAGLAAVSTLPTGAETAGAGLVVFLTLLTSTVTTGADLTEFLDFLAAGMTVDSAGTGAEACNIS